MTIIIPDGIVALPDLSLAERVALAHLRQWPGTRNSRLANLLGLSERGVEQMLRRLRERGLIPQRGKGHARVLRVIFPVEHHTECGTKVQSPPVAAQRSRQYFLVFKPN